MSGKSKRQEDAESIIGKHADELEKEDQKLVGRTSGDIDPLAVVERKKHPSGNTHEDEDEVDDAAEEDEDEDEGKRKRKKRAFKGAAPPFGGAKSLADAETFMVDRAGDDPILLDSLNVLAGVLTNIAGTEHGEAIATELAEYQTRLDAQVLRTLNSVEQSLTNGKEVPMPEENVVETPQVEVQPEAEVGTGVVVSRPQHPGKVDLDDDGMVTGSSREMPGKSLSDEHVLAPVFASLQAAYDEARETPADQAVRLKMIQEPLNDFAAALKANIGGTDAPAADAAVGGGITIEQLQQAVALGVAPLAAELEALRSASVVNNVAPAPVDEPVRRALQTAAFAAVGQGAQKEVIMEADQRNPKTDKNVTPGLRSLVRRTVGLGG